MAGELARVGGLAGDAVAPGRKTRKALVAGLAEAAGAPLVTEAVAAGYRRDARSRVGWPVTRWLSRFRAHPLKRLGLDAGRPQKATSLPRPGKAQLSTLRHTLREVAEEATQGLEAPWPARVRAVLLGDVDRLADPLDQAIAAAELRTGESPAWWGVFRVLQTLLLATAAGGLVWLAVLFGFNYLRLPEPPTPEWRGFPIPTLMTLGGAGGGILLALLGRGLARIGGRRRASRAEKALATRIQQVADDHILAPLEAEISSRTELASALEMVRGTGG